MTGQLSSGYKSGHALRRPLKIKSLGLGTACLITGWPTNKAATSPPCWPLPTCELEPGAKVSMGGGREEGAATETDSDEDADAPPQMAALKNK